MSFIDFHAHLAACEQCRAHPFDLCGAGAILLERIEADWRDLEQHSPPARPPFRCPCGERNPERFAEPYRCRACTGRAGKRLRDC
jgi:hypothetical protein